MISKVIIGKTFYGVCSYICKDQKRALVLETEGVRGHDYKLMSADFKMQQSLRPSLKKAVFHGILSFYPGEKITDDKMVEIAKEYLKEMGIVDTQYSITKHLDRNHLHLHIIANLINNKGQTIKDNWIGFKGKKVAQKLTIKYGLKPALSKNLELTNLERLNEKEANRYLIYQAISAALPHSRNLEELKQQLGRKGIEIFYKHNGQLEELQGISFKLGEYKYKGSSIDRKLSLNNLQRAMQQNQLKYPLYPSFKNTIDKNISQLEARTSSKEIRVDELTILKDLMKPEINLEQLPYDLKKKKRKRKSQRLR